MKSKFANSIASTMQESSFTPGVSSKTTIPMQNIKAHIRTLQEFHDTNNELTEAQKAAIKAGIAALKKDQMIKLLGPLLWPFAKLFLYKYRYLKIAVFLLKKLANFGRPQFEN